MHEFLHHLRTACVLAALLLGACERSEPQVDTPAPAAVAPLPRSTPAGAALEFRQLDSAVRDVAALWAGFEDELAAFGQSGYQRLLPLVLEAGVQELQQAVAAGRVDYEALTLFYLWRIRNIEGDPARRLNAVIAINPQALAQARAADQARQAGLVAIAPHSLFGLPVLLKDNIAAAGMPTTAGAAALQHNYSPDAFIVTRLQTAGAVILGKTNLSEWAYFFCDECPSGWSAVGGQTLNPYGRLSIGTGGSSSGSGAAAAANLAVVTVGSETSGSILSPASRHAAVGFKPTTGRLSRSGVIPISPTLDTTGPITRSVHDAISLFNAMQGFDAQDPAMEASHDGPLSFTPLTLAGQRLGYFADWLDEPLYAKALAAIAAAGAITVALDLPETTLNDFDALLGGEMRHALPAWLQQHASDGTARSLEEIVSFNQRAATSYAPYGQALFDMMLTLELSEDEVEALGARLQQAATASLQTMFQAQELDALLSLDNRSAALAALANHPALTLPLGLTGDGRPQGLTLIEEPWQEQDLVGLALTLERLVGGRQAPANY